MEGRCGLRTRFPLPGRFLRVKLPNLFLFLECQAGELHPDRALIGPPHRAGRPDGPVADRKAEVQDQLGLERDRLLRGEGRPRGPELDDPPLLRAVAFDVVLHRDVAGNTRRVSCISLFTHGDGGRD